MINSAPYLRVAEELRKLIQEQFSSIGILCRVFARGKSRHSLSQKVAQTLGKYNPARKLVQDAVGLRIVLYFPEDVTIVEEILRSTYKCDDASCTIDLPNASVFSVTRHNLLFEVPKPWVDL